MSEIDRDGEAGTAVIPEWDILVEEADRVGEIMTTGTPHRDATRAAPGVPRGLQVAVGAAAGAEGTFGHTVPLGGHHWR
jgi:hypothetical protein